MSLPPNYYGNGQGPIPPNYPGQMQIPMQANMYGQPIYGYPPMPMPMYLNPMYGQQIPMYPGQQIPMYPGQPMHMYPGQPIPMYPGHPMPMYPGQQLPMQMGMNLQHQSNNFPGQNSGQVFPNSQGQIIPQSNNEQVNGQVNGQIPFSNSPPTHQFLDTQNLNLNADVIGPPPGLKKNESKIAITTTTVTEKDSNLESFLPKDLFEDFVSVVISPRSPGRGLKVEVKVETSPDSTPRTPSSPSKNTANTANTATTVTTKITSSVVSAASAEPTASASATASAGVPLSSSSMPVHFIEIVTNKKGKMTNIVKRDIPYKDVKLSEYKYSPGKSEEKKSLIYLRGICGTDDYIVCVTYPTDTQWAATETKKRGESTAKTAERCAKEEFRIFVRAHNFDSLDPVDFSKRIYDKESQQSKIITTTKQTFILNLNDKKNSNIKPYFGTGPKNKDDNNDDVHDGTKPLVLVVGKLDRLIELLSKSEPNDGITGYTLVPVFHPLADLLVGNKLDADLLDGNKLDA